MKDFFEPLGVKEVFKITTDNIGGVLSLLYMVDEEEKELLRLSLIHI